MAFECIQSSQPNRSRLNRFTLIRKTVQSDARFRTRFGMAFDAVFLKQRLNSFCESILRRLRANRIDEYEYEYE